MKLSRQARRAICRTMAKKALQGMPLRESRPEHRKSLTLLAKRMFSETPKEVEPSRLVLPPQRRIITIEEFVNQANGNL